MKILVTAGPTREPIDAVRFLSNRSSGKMGYAVARAAVRRGHAVRLVSGPVALAPPDGAAVTAVRTAADMLEAVRANLPWCDVLIMAAAVADWRPVRPAAGKLKKRKMAPTLELERTADILDAVRPHKGGRLLVGFAAETDAVEREARRKLVAKGLDLIVANDVGREDAGFEADTNRVTFLAPDGTSDALPLLGKDEVAERLLDRVEAARASAA